MKYFVWLVRIFVGVLFIVSGFVKLVDPLGFSYKLIEYYEVFASYGGFGFFGGDFFTDSALFTSMFMAVLEISLGVALLIGYRIKLTLWILLLLIVFFTALTGFSVITGKVTDCGCFGDAVKLTPNQSFNKDLLLLGLILILLFFKKYIKKLFNSKVRFGLFFLFTLIAAAITSWSYNHLPIVDFRPYKIGNHLPTLMKAPPGCTPSVWETIFIYENPETGESKEFGLSNLPKKPWKFKDRTDKEVVKGDCDPKITDLAIFDKQGTEVTMDLLANKSHSFWVVGYDIGKTGAFSSAKVKRELMDVNLIEDSLGNIIDTTYDKVIAEVEGLTFSPEKKYAKAYDGLLDVAKQANAQNMNFIVLSASPDDQADAVVDAMGGKAKSFSVDQTVLKTILRSNPGLVLMKEGVVLDKWHYHDIPKFEKIKKKHKL